MGKYITPILIVGLIFSWLIFQALSLITVFRIYGETITVGQKIVLLGGIFAFSVALISVLVQRISEIKEEDKEDLSNY